MKILLINQHFHPEVASSGQIMTELCEDFVRAGHQVTVLTGRPSYQSSEEQVIEGTESIHGMEDGQRYSVGRIVFNLAKIMPERILELDEVYGVNIVRAYTYSPQLKEGAWRIVQRFVQYLTFFFTSFFVALLLPRHDIVLYLSTPPLLNGVTAIALKILKGSINIYNIQDLYPDVAVKLGAVRNKWVIKACSILEKELYHNASLLVPVGEKMASVLRDKGVSSGKIQIIPNWMDTEKIRPVGKDTPFSHRNNLLDKFVVMYSGNMGLSQGLEVVLRCAELTRDEDILYLMVGGGASKRVLLSMVKDLELSNVEFLPYQPKERLSESLGSADIHLIPLKKGLSNYSVPSKIFGIMASGRPLITSVDEGSEISIMVQKADCGLVIRPEDPHALAEAILSLYHDRIKIEELGKNGREFLERTNTREICTGRYIEVIDRVIA